MHAHTSAGHEYVANTALCVLLQVYCFEDRLMENHSHTCVDAQTRSMPQPWLCLFELAMMEIIIVGQLHIH